MINLVSDMIFDWEIMYLNYEISFQVQICPLKSVLKQRYKEANVTEINEDTKKWHTNLG